MNDMPPLNLSSSRARKARLAVVLGGGISSLLLILCLALAGVGAYCIFIDTELARIGYFCLAASSFTAVIHFWERYDLRHLPLRQPANGLEDLIEQHLLASLKKPLSPQSVWKAVAHRPEARFMTNHLLVDPQAIEQNLSANEQDMAAVWQHTLSMVAHRKNPEIHAGIIATAIMQVTPAVQTFLTSVKITPGDVLETASWLDRQIQYIKQARPFFGGIGRDWAAGFTPTLEHFGQNISQQVEAGHYSKYLAHADILPSVAGSLTQGNGVALVGPDGVGKTSLVYGLAERLLEGRDPHLQYYQVISLNASVIISNGGDHLEDLMLTLFGEAVSAGNIILFLDDAHLFFGSGVGAFDISQMLLPVLKNHRVKVIAAFTPSAWQQLQSKQSTVTTSFASVTVTEPPEADILTVVEDEVAALERQHAVIISIEAIREAYRLSGQYMQEQAYPGKVLTLIEQAMPYVEHQALTAQTIQVAIEKVKGVRVSAAQAPEADMLLHLEDRIHERMINQKRAVNVVASALRRGRAGVSNPKRPVGSFLFLGPTGVGKTELARSLAAVYYGDEQNMIRLDMSEYQRPEDVTRLLATGGQNAQSLLLAIREQPFSVVLLDEIEKAHPNILNLLLQMLDEGQLTDEQGRPASFRSSIIITTSNAGAPDIAARVQAGGELESFERPLIDKLIQQGQFKPELMNRFDEVVLFRPLNEEEMGQVAQVMLRSVNATLATQHISVELTPDALKTVVHAGYDPEFGARPMRRIIQKTVENAVAVKILAGETQPGDVITLDISDIAPKE